MNTSDEKKMQKSHFVYVKHRGCPSIFFVLCLFNLVLSLRLLNSTNRTISPRKRSPEDFDAVFFCSSNFFFSI